MKTKLVIIGLAALFVAACASSHRLNNLHLGMSEAEAVKVLGAPDARAENKNGNVTLYYQFFEGQHPYPYSVVLVNGKVDSYQRDGGTGKTSQPMPVIVPMVH